MRHRHSTPFEMCELKLHVKLPIFVARQWVRHRTANINEYSARYSILDKEFYVPDKDFLTEMQKEKKSRQKAEKTEAKIRKTEEKSGQIRMFTDINFLDVLNPKSPRPEQALSPEATAAQSKHNKQGREGALSPDEAKEVLEEISRESSRAYTIYKKLLNEEDGRSLREDREGIARELARIILPTNYYTQWYWKIDLHNLFHFLSLRADSHAQKEIRVYADVISEIAQRWVPLAWQAFVEYRREGVHLSAAALDVVKRRMRGETVTQQDSGMSKREWRELVDALGLDE